MHTCSSLKEPSLNSLKIELCSYLNEGSVLSSIRTRYAEKGQIYTYSGIVLVAVNPFAAVPLYEPNLVQAYAGKRKGEVSVLCLISKFHYENLTWKSVTISPIA